MRNSSRVLVLALASFLRLSAVSAGPHDAQARRLESASSLRLHFTIKRSSMFINGASEFDVFANPVLSGDNVAFNGQVVFVDGTMVQKYVLADGVTYSVMQSNSASAASTVSCLPAAVITSLQELVGAINAATPVANVVVDDQQVSCDAGSAYQIAFGGETFALCAAKQASGAGFKIVGSDLDIEAFYLSEAVNTTAPSLDAAVASTCEKVATTTTLTAVGKALLTRTAVEVTAPVASANATRTLTQNAEEATATVAASSCACKSIMRPCIFIKGLGATDDSGLSDTDKTGYFGDIKNHAPCCSSVKFAMINTVDFPWTSATQQQKVCDLAIAMSPTSSASTKTIDNTIVVAHSMGNLLLAGAIANGRCKLSSTSTWVAMSGPMKGSMASDYLQNACSGNSNSLVSAVANLIGRCPANAAITSLAYEGEAYASTLGSQYVAAQTVYRSYVSAVMCSNAHDGLLSTDQVVFNLAAAAINHKSKENDGLVEYQSCAGGFPTSKFGATHTSPFYVTRLNHADTRFLHGDALFNDAQKPVKWFECLL
ncbi:hypothetical protein FI667_g4494, partial [Globisporangium splendens]